MRLLHQLKKRKLLEAKPATPKQPGRSSFFAVGGALNGSIELGSTGTASFDADDTAGNDSTAANDIVRVNDTFVYRINYVTGADPVNNFTTKIVLPKGVTIPELPGICKKDGSSIEPADPYNGVIFPLQDNALEQMQPQTVTCNLGNVPASSTQQYSLTARLSNLAPQGHVLTPASFSFKGDGHAEETITQGLPSIKASSKLKWDVSKNTYFDDADKGYFTSPVFSSCPWDTARSCFRTSHSVLLMAPNGGKGAMPGIGDITLVDDLTPESLYAHLPAESIQKMNADLDKYGSRIYPAINNYSIPGSKIGVTENNIVLNEKNSVINSGTMKIDGQNPGPAVGSGPGKKVTLTFEGADLSLRTSPKIAARPVNLALPTDKAFAISQSFFMYTPVDTVNEFGQPDKNALIIKR